MATTTKICDQKTVGIVIRDQQDRHLLIERGTLPIGMAPVAGHWDLDAGADHGTLRTPEDVARAEVAEEAGLMVKSLVATSVHDLWVPTWCRRRLPDGVLTSGHRWTVYEATVTGELAPDSRETRGARWVTLTDLQALAERTALYASGELTDIQFEARPGLEPVWVELYAALGYIALPPADLRVIAALATEPPQ